ncbi:MAG TPA: sulfite exporter TauE/SafE family protein, partial [Candidatus Jeotgalibaca merdavium]|nr:sulfite exporter TauE/SafE family protein [Candidatus Jeotgalibaca merdavium]
MFGLETIEVLMLVLAAVIVGFSKAGIQGATIPAVAMLALIFGGKESAGIMLPMLIVGDLVAIFKYGKQGNI